VTDYFLNRIHPVRSDRRGDNEEEMMGVISDFPDLEQVIDAYHEGIEHFMTGNCEYSVELLSRRYVTLGNPFGPWACGFDQVAAAMRRTSPNYAEGRAIGFDRFAEYADPDMAYIVELERLEAKVAGREYFQQVDLRTTSIFRPEDGTWRLIHRHVDLTNSVKTVASVIEPLDLAELVSSAS
jgi:ketosteroid isomerase-like protein